MYKKILVALDLSDESMDLRLLTATDGVADDGADIFCLHVVESIPTYALAQVPDDVMPKVLKIASETAGNRLDESGLSATLSVRSGKPASAILEAAAEMGAEVIVIGSHQLGLQDIFLGSTAARVVRHAKCDVLVRRPVE